jgi:hypothetical protein
MALGLVVVAAFASGAQGEVYNYSYADLGTLGENVENAIPGTPVLAQPSYLWSFAISRIQLRFAPLDADPYWWTVPKVLFTPPEYPHGAGTSTSLPIVFWEELPFKATVSGEFVLSSNLKHWINEAGVPHLDFNTVKFGTMGGVPIAGLRASGTVTVVPEPSSLVLATLGLLGAFGMVRVQRRRRASASCS